MSSVRALSQAQIGAYNRQGFLRVPAAFEIGELSRLVACLEASEPNEAPFKRVGPLDYLGWVEPGDDLIGRLCRAEGLVHCAEQLIGEGCYHYHSKIVRKPVGREEALDWHQDFGSWYKDGCVAPMMLTAVVALTRADRENGCLQFIEGSHRLGRLDRLSAGHESYTYFALNEIRLSAIRERFETVFAEMDVGDVVFFHANTLHASGPNASAAPRILFETSYNALSNAPVFRGQSYHQARGFTRVNDEALVPGPAIPVSGLTRFVDIDDPDDEAAGIFRRRHDPGLC